MILSVEITQACVQFGIVSQDGKVAHAKKFEMRDWIASMGVVHYLIAELKKYIHLFPEIKQVGIGMPGLLSADRRTIIHTPHIPSLDNIAIASILHHEFPQLEIKVERSANCMALGEFHFGKYQTDNFLLVSLDDCLESGAIIDQKLFGGAHGNGVQLASVLINADQSLEKVLRWHYLEEYIYKQIDRNAAQHSLLTGKSLSPELVYKAALQGDVIAKSVFVYVGHHVGNALVSVLPILDVSTVLVTGRLAIATNLLVPYVYEQLKIHLAEYYTQKLSVKKAVVGEKAGLLGAACLFI